MTETKENRSSEESYESSVAQVMNNERKPSASGNRKIENDSVQFEVQNNIVDDEALNSSAEGKQPQNVQTIDKSSDNKASTKNYFTHQQIVRILYGLMLGMFLAALDQTIVSTSIRTIGDDLHGLSMQAWVTTAYLITSTITTPIYGKLGDQYGRKKLFLFAISIFVLGSAACSFSTNMTMLAVFRAVQGLGAGGLFTLALAIIGDIVPPRERAKYTGYFMAVFATSSVLGPVVGGLFAETNSILAISGWRWVFLVNVPIGVAALFVVAKTLHLDQISQKAKIDWWGAAALTVSLVPLLVVAEQGREWGWTSTKSIFCYALGVVAALAFVLMERKMQEDALMPMHLFRNKTIVVSVLVSIVLGAGMFGGMMILPLYMQIVHGASPMKAGLMMLPLVAGMMVSAMLSGQITSKTGHVRNFPIVGIFVAAAALLLLSTVSASTSLGVVMLWMLLFGIGLGNCMQPLSIIVQNAVSPADIGVATSAATFSRQLGGTLGVAVWLSILFSSLAGNMKESFNGQAQAIKSAVESNPQLLHNSYNASVAHGDKSIFEQVQNNSSIINKMSDVFSFPIKQGFSNSMSTVFLLAAVVLFIGFVVALFMPKVTLREPANSIKAANVSE